MRSYSSIVIFLIIAAACHAGGNQPDIDPADSIEIFITEPVIIENIYIWVPAARSGPFTNYSCKMKKNLTTSSTLSNSVLHNKTDHCPEQTARILAEITSSYHLKSLPLTIFNGWRWEHNSGISNYESNTYDLREHGGFWENGWEAILNFSCGSIHSQWLDIASPEKFSIHKSLPSESMIKIKTFSSMRIRDGYPRKNYWQEKNIYTDSKHGGMF